MVNVYGLISVSTWILPVGCRYVRGGKRTSASPGKADNHCTSAPCCKPLSVQILKIKQWPLSPDCIQALYSTAVLKSVVVDMGAHCIHTKLEWMSVKMYT